MEKNEKDPSRKRKKIIFTREADLQTTPNITHGFALTKRDLHKLPKEERLVRNRLGEMLGFNTADVNDKLSAELKDEAFKKLIILFNHSNIDIKKALYSDLKELLTKMEAVIDSESKKSTEEGEN